MRWNYEEIEVSMRGRDVSLPMRNWTYLAYHLGILAYDVSLPEEWNDNKEATKWLLRDVSYLRWNLFVLHFALVPPYDVSHHENWNHLAYHLGILFAYDVTTYEELKRQQRNHKRIVEGYSHLRIETTFLIPLIMPSHTMLAYLWGKQEYSKGIWLQMFDVSLPMRNWNIVKKNATNTQTCDVSLPMRNWNPSLRPNTQFARPRC